MKRIEEKLPKAEWTSLIDIIFQLLIFFMVTMALGTLQRQAQAAVKGAEKKNLPKLPPVEKLATPQDITTGYLLHINEINEKPFNGQLGAYILDPEFPTVEDAKKDTLGGHGPFALNVAKAKLQKKIEDEFFRTGEPPRLEIRAHQKTSFGYILDIMEFCDRDSIEVVGFRFANVKKQL
ncbi:hypothetical protein DRQ33_00910 [bacterium]|nr:MAG: hypothetical protein DRQ33_00910 [bacterium]